MACLMVIARPRQGTDLLDRIHLMYAQLKTQLTRARPVIIDK